MPLRLELADEVRFECEKCRASHGLIRIRWNQGKCRKCSGTMFTMITEYYEGQGRKWGLIALLFADAMEGLIARKLGIAINAIKIPLHRERTDGVPGEEALLISRLGLYGSKHEAYDFMRLRKAEEFQDHRETLLASGSAGYCVACGSFYVAAPDKPWTLAKYCTKVCHVRVAGPGDVAGAPASMPQPSVEPGRRTLPIACACGHTYQVPATFVGARRACPQCGVKNVVNA